MIHVLLALAVLLLGASPARADLLQDIGATFEQVAASLAAVFPKVEAQVVAVDGERLRVEGATVPSLRHGLELSVFRRGEAFRHPVTGQVLGHAEQDLGVLVVEEVAGQTATGRLIGTTGAPAAGPGDGARLTAGRLPVAVLPTSGVQAAFDNSDQTQFLLVARFSALLEKTGRFLAVDPQRVLGASQATQGSAPSPIEVSRKLGGSAVLSSRLVRDGTVRVLETTWISGRTGTTLVALRTPLVTARYPPRFAWEETPELERRYPLDGGARAVALGDLDGDGQLELVVGDEQTVVAYRVVDGRTLVPVEGISFRPGGSIIAVDAAPLLGGSRSQLVVVDVRDQTRVGIRARVLEWSPAGFRVLYETTGRHLRVVSVGGESWLLEQDAGETEAFEQEVRRLVWDGRAFRDGLHVRVPRGVNVYGLALMKLTGGAEPEIVATTPEDRLMVISSRGRVLWTSPDSLGGSAITFPFGPLGGRSEAAQDQGIARVSGRVLPLPALGGADGPEILVFENLLGGAQQARGLLPRLAPALVSRGRIHRLRWKDGAFLRVWQSGITEGYIADFAYGDIDGDGIPDVVVGVVPRGLDLETLNPFGRPRGRIVAYELP